MDLEICCVCVLFVFFKQKTAYEMRISDWSSDVCSSDLCGRGTPARVPPRCCGCWLRTSCRASFSPFSLDRSFLLRLPCYGCQGPPNPGSLGALGGSFPAPVEGGRMLVSNWTPISAGLHIHTVCHRPTATTYVRVALKDATPPPLAKA